MFGRELGVEVPIPENADATRPSQYRMAIEG